MDNQFGRIVNPFLTCEEGKKLTEDNFDGSEYTGQGSLDDPAGEVIKKFSFSDLVASHFELNSKGEIYPEPGPVADSDPKDNYTAVFKIWSAKINEPSRFRVTLNSIKCLSADDDGDVEEPYGKLGIYLASAKYGRTLTPEEYGEKWAGIIPLESNLLFNKNADQNLSLKKDQVQQIGESRIFEFSPSDDANAYFTIWGDLDEDDGWSGKDDKLEKYKETDEKIKVLVKDVVSKKKMVKMQRFGSGNTLFEVQYTLEHLSN